MTSHDPRIDAYIARQADFARPTARRDGWLQAACGFNLWHGKQAEAMRDNTAARGHWDALTPGKQREYADWITGAKGADTRARRVAQAVEWIAEGKTRNWKCAGC